MKIFYATLGALTLALSGCASAPPSMLLSLPAVASTGTSVRTLNPTMPVLAVGRLELPEYLVSRRVRYKIDASTVGEWPETYWAERVEVGISREFNAALQQNLPAWRVCEANCTPEGAATALQVTLVQLDYLRSERRLVGKVRLTLQNTSVSHTVLRGEERAYQMIASGDTAQAQAQAITQLLQQVARDAAALTIKTM